MSTEIQREAEKFAKRVWVVEAEMPVGIVAVMEDGTTRAYPIKITSQESRAFVNATISDGPVAEVLRRSKEG